MNKETILKAKAYLKSEATMNSAMKARIKEESRSGNIGTAGTLQYKLIGQRRKWRHMHAAYCLLLGRTLEQVEQKTALGNELNTDLLEKYKSDILGGTYA